MDAGLLNMTRHLLIYWVYEQNKTKKGKMEKEWIDQPYWLNMHIYLFQPLVFIILCPWSPHWKLYHWVSFVLVMQAIPQDSCVSVMICDIEELLSFHNSVSCCDWSLFLSIIYLSSNYHLYHPSISSSYLCVYCLSIYIHT